MVDIQHIDPKQYITNFVPVWQSPQAASGWYETETKTIKAFSTDTSDGTQALAWELAQGWFLTNTVYGERSPTTGIMQITYSLKRRTLKAEKALQDLINQSTEGYNWGRKMNDQRYDDIVTIYSVLLDKTEDTLASLDGDDDYAADKIDGVLDLLPADYEEHAADPDIDLDAYGTAQRARINLQYDNLLTTLKQSLIQRGMYTTTVYDTDVIGIEGERTIALNAFEDDLMRLKADMAHKLYDQKISMRQGVMNAYERFSTVRDNGMNALQLQSKICMAMLNFMERREDGYPDISAISQTAAQFGSSNSTEVAP